MLKKGDYIVICCVFVFACALLVFGIQDSGGLLAQVWQGDELLHEVLMQGLASPIRITVTGLYQNEVEIGAGYARVISASCPLETCVHTGAISRAGQSIVCLENRVVVTLLGSGESELDGILG